MTGAGARFISVAHAIVGTSTVLMAGTTLLELLDVMRRSESIGGRSQLKKRPLHARSAGASGNAK